MWSAAKLKLINWCWQAKIINTTLLRPSQCTSLCVILLIVDYLSSRRMSNNPTSPFLTKNIYQRSLNSILKITFLCYNLWIILSHFYSTQKSQITFKMFFSFNVHESTCGSCEEVNRKFFSFIFVRAYFFYNVRHGSFYKKAGILEVNEI